MTFEFKFGRYPTQILLAAFEQADKSKPEIITLENDEPWFSIEISGFNMEDDLLFDVISHIEEFDAIVQSFCKDNYERRKLSIENYLVGLHWIEKEEDEITFGYCGECVNIELRAIFSNKDGKWETVDLYYQ